MTRMIDRWKFDASMADEGINPVKKIKKKPKDKKIKIKGKKGPSRTGGDD